MVLRGAHLCRRGEEEVDMRLLYVRDVQLLGLLWRFFPFSYRLPERNAMLVQVCRERGWKGEEESHHHSWNLWWRSAYVKGASRVVKLKSWQTLNHIPNAANYCKKDVLVRYLRRMKSSFGAMYDFCPISFNLPTEYAQLVGEHRRRRGQGCDNSPQPLYHQHHKVIWIAKPVGKSQGRGIFVFQRCSDLRYDDQYVVQAYIHRPLLIDGYKWDLRLYVCITCNNPLTFYAYTEGIVRFATHKYDLSDLDDTFSHLTNTSLNKQSPTYYKNKETVGLGSKWTLAHLRGYFREQGISDYWLWQKIWSILVLTIVGEGKTISHQQWEDNRFQFLGFDVLVDWGMKPHLLEVNVHPALGSDKACAVDVEVKVPMLHDMFDLLGLPDGRKFPEPDTTHKSLDKTELCGRILEAAKEVDPHHYRPFADRPHNPHHHTHNCSLLTIKKTGRRKALKEKLKGVELQGCVDPNNNEVAVTPPIMPDYDPDDPRVVRTPPPLQPCPVLVCVPVIKKVKSRLHLPLNGPGLTFVPPQWKKDAPVECGKWVRIFPFDTPTRQCSSFAQTTDCRDAINRVGVFLQSVRELVGVGQGQQSPDSHYDAILRKSLTTNVWHP